MAAFVTFLSQFAVWDSLTILKAFLAKQRDQFDNAADVPFTPSRQAQRTDQLRRFYRDFECAFEDKMTHARKPRGHGGWLACVFIDRHLSTDCEVNGKRTLGLARSRKHWRRRIDDRRAWLRVLASGTTALLPHNRHSF